MAIPILDEESTEQFLSGGGEMGKLIRTMDWANTPLGPISSWPQSLRTSVSLCLSSTFPILIAWGPETIQIYNDSYRPICGAKHPESMGQNFRICWETALPVVGDKFTRGQQGEGTYITDQRMFLDRYGYLEESFMTFSFAPIRDESGGVGGIFHPITESTEKMLGARRTQALKDLGASIGKAKTIEEIGTLTVAQYENYQLDIPFLSFYTLQNQQATLVASSGVQQGSKLAPATLSIDDNLWQLEQVVATEAVVVLDNLSEKFGEFACEPYEEPPVKAVILPVHISGQSEVFGFLIAGVSARRALDQAYLNFYEQLVGTYNTAVSNVYAYEQEQKRAEALAAIDRSKTAFFSNVSHEFRTPLTLMLGPLEELLQKEHLDEGTSLQLEATHRNALRLLKLVNNLLDYSRVEAGRTTAVYQPVDLFELTVDLASSFRSIIEKAGMQLIVSCEPLEDVFYVDKQMWEKVVLNLLSNAFKYTLQGTITVELKQIGQHAVLKVIDTGVGIPEKELPHMFERFHRIENTAGRTHEGTGIGLSLVHELIQLHGGTITVDSIEGEGSIFTVQLASGKAHLPKEHVIETTKDMDSSSVKGAFIKEAYGLLQEDYQSDGPVSKSRPEQENKIDESISVLVVDDNADMRNYLQRLLNPYYTVNTAVNGQDALRKIEQHLPDLVLSDMMMPVMDGKALLSHLRAQHDTSRLPVIFLSARAGEEARIDGLAAGADDYLVKPFSASELLAKVQAQIHINKTRGNAEQQLRSLFEQAPVAIAVYRGSDHIVEVANEKMLSYWGKSLHDVMEQPVFKVMDTLADQGFKDHMDQVYLTGQPYIARSAQAVLHRFGQIDAIYLDLTIEPLRDDKGQIIGTITVAADVTEQTEFRKTIEKANNTLQLAIEASNVGIWQAELQTGKLHLSAAARQIYGLHTEEPLTFDEILPRLAQEDGGIQVREAIDSAIKSKGKFHENYQIQPFDSSPKKWVNINGMVELDGEGQATSIIGTILDITESKEDELRKNDFIGMVSHELKTPLTSLTGYTQLGLRSSTKSGDTQLASIFERATIQVRKMTNMINGFLSVAQLESGKINLKISQFNTSAFVNETLEDVKLVADGQEFELEVQDITLHADRDKLATVLTNLLTNAIKYGEKGKPIIISCLIHSDNLLISVKNSGMGINANNLDRLFDRFFREERTQTQHISGFGIGLYLCAEIIRRHHGKIWAESEPGVETTFFFEIPLVYTKALESN